MHSWHLCSCCQNTSLFSYGLPKMIYSLCSTLLVDNSSDVASPKCFILGAVFPRSLNRVTYVRLSLQSALLLGELFKPLLGSTRSRGRCWAAIRFSHRPEPSGHAVHGEVDRLIDIGGQHGRRFVLLRHTHRPQRRPYPICTSRSRNFQHWCGGG